MTTVARLRGILAVATTILLTVPPCASSAVAGPYEILANWTKDAGRLTPAGVDFAFDAIEYVPRLGIMIYGDHLLLRIEHGEPFVTLGIAARHDAETPARYGSAAVLADGGRLMTRTSVRREGGARVRETTVIRFDADDRREAAVAFPLPSEGAAWTNVRLFTDADGQVFAYAGRGRPTTVPVTFDDVWPALEQRFYRLTANQWQELPALDPAIVSATDACFVDRSLIVVGSRIEKDAAGNVTVRRGVAAELAEGRWSVSDPPRPPGAEAFSMSGLRCGRTRDRVYALAVAAAPGQAISHTFLSGAPALYRLDGEGWQAIPLPDRSPGDGSGSPRVTAFTVDRTGAVWLSYAAVGAGVATLKRYKDGSWSPAALAHVPEVASYSLSGIAFDDDGNGWAIANRDGNSTAPESHGILLGFDGNVRNEWRLRGWGWNPLRQRAFGLVGNLR